MNDKKRTPLQNKSLHKFCEMLADAFNDAGLDMKAVLKPDIDIPWRKESVKEHIWRPIQLAMLNKESTVKLETKECSEVYEVLSRHLGDKFGIHVPWPSLDEQSKQEASYENINGR